MPRSGNEAIAWARNHLRWPVGYCQMYVRTAFGLGGGFGSASAQWYGARHRHFANRGAQCPRGVPVFWTGGSRGYGHVALSTGNGMCWSTDAGGAGRVAHVSIDGLTSRWGLNFVGWTEDMNGTYIGKGGASKPKKKWWKVKFAIDLSEVRPGKRNWGVRRVQRALRKKGYNQKVTGYYGDQTRDNVRRFQRRIGFRGNDADGRIGKTSARRLGLKPR